MRPTLRLAYLLQALSEHGKCGVAGCEDMRAVARTSIDASFAHADVKRQLPAALAHW
ncbi:hypothetical protein [Rhodoferax sp. UBA5149]|uniref:hypothetical protein n=1 Tax=Rhodoferax sp. UBA5149 TaxID=1947379 RepID=UPI0025E20A21|nr:hypothetical protein [Rhodoferax sp. UBA5149]